MDLQETVARWHAEERLAVEYAQLQRILEGRKFTREHIAYCFETMLPGLALLAADRDTHELTLDALRQKLREVLEDEVRIVEHCGVLVDVQTKPEREVLKDLQRAAANQLWQRQSPEEGFQDGAV